MTKRFAGVYVGDVDLDARDIDSGEGIAQRDTGMRERGGVDNNELGAISLCLMHRLDQLLLAVALQTGDFGAGALRLGLQAMVDFIKSFRAIDFRLASAEQIQIWAVQYEDCRHGPVHLTPIRGASVSQKCRRVHFFGHLHIFHRR